MFIRAKHFWFLGIAAFTTILGMCSTLYLPDKYFFDAYLIALDTFNEKALVGSYPFSMLFYHITRMSYLPFALVALIQLPLVFWAIKKLGIPNNFHRPTLRNTVVWITMIILAVYLSMPSKEFITLLYMSIICYVLIGPYRLWAKVLLSSLLFVFFGLWFRQYFILVPVMGILLFMASHIKIQNRVLLNIIGGVLIICFLSLSHGFIKGEYMTQSFREKINKVRVGREDSQTIITSPVEIDNIFGESISIFYGFFSVNLPVNSIKFYYKPQVMAFLFWQLLLFGYLVYFYSKCLNNRKNYKHEEWIFHFVFAYLIIQGVFEPDLGSAVKHKLGVFPLLYLALFFDRGLVKRLSNPRKYVFR